MMDMKACFVSFIVTATVFLNERGYPSKLVYSTVIKHGLSLAVCVQAVFFVIFLMAVVVVEELIRRRTRRNL